MIGLLLLAFTSGPRSIRAFELPPPEAGGGLGRGFESPRNADNPPAQQHIRRLYVISPLPANAIALAKFLGPNYSVRDWGPLRWNEKFGTLLPIPYEDRDLSTGIVIEPSLSSYTQDRFVPEFRSDLEAMRKVYGAAYALAPAPKDESEATILVPLIRQAAREAGVRVIESETGSSFAEAVGDAVLDQRLEKKSWRLVHTDSQQIDEGPAANAIDGDPNTYWHTQYDPTQPRPPHEIVVDMGSAQSVAGIRYVPRQDGGVNGRVKGFKLYLSDDGVEWGVPVLKGDLPNTAKPTRIKLDHPVTARYFRFVATSEVNNGPWTSAAEIDILRAKP